MAPEVRLARGVSWGRALDVACAFGVVASFVFAAAAPDVEEGFVPTSRFARVVRRAFKLVKYSALPTLVRMTEGSVPRHNWRIGLGWARMLRMVERREEEPDCWTRVLRRSAGWRRIEEVKPEARPARRWKALWRGEC